MVGAVIAIVLILLLMYIARDQIFGGAEKIAEFGSCEKGVAGETGICVISTYTCKNIGGFENSGELFGGCPSTKTKAAYGDDAKDYSKCCVLETCTEAGLYQLKGDKYTAKNIEKCLGNSKDCTEKNNCCCVKEIPKK